MSHDAKRLTVGLPFSYQEDWIGGLYYVRNLVSAIGLLPASLRPRLFVIGDDPRAIRYLKSETAYPDIHRVPPLAINRIATRNFLGFSRPRTWTGTSIDLILMGSDLSMADRTIQWVPDFQEEHFPEYFSPAELQARRRRNMKWFKRHRHILVSSQDVLEDFKRFYGGKRNILHVVRFASFANCEPIDSAVTSTRTVPLSRYFICCNQLWRHKNHSIILEALASLLGGEVMPQVVFTGPEHDYREPSFAASVKQLAAELGVSGYAHFLGLLPRPEQLRLISNAIAVVQPSLCEGWSTIIEDAKALDRHVLASDIPVHREQIGTNVDFFNPHDAASLAMLLRRYHDHDPHNKRVNYSEAQNRFAADLGRLILEVVKDFDGRGVSRLVVDEELMEEE